MLLIQCPVPWNTSVCDHYSSKFVPKFTKSQKPNFNFPTIHRFEAVKSLSKDKLQSLQSLGLIYFLYLFIYSGLEFTVTFLMYHKFGYTSIDQAKMFLTTGIVMAFLQGSVVRRLPSARTKSSAVFGLVLIVPAFILVGIARDGKLLYAGMILFAICKCNDNRSKSSIPNKIFVSYRQF